MYTITVLDMSDIRRALVMYFESVGKDDLAKRLQLGGVVMYAEDKQSKEKVELGYIEIS